MGTRGLIHIRRNLVAYLALFVSLSTGTAWAAGTIGSADVIDNSLRSVDLRNGGAVRGVDVVDDDLTAADLGPASVGSSELNPTVFASGDIDLQSNGYGVSPDAIQSSEIEDGQVTSADVAGNTLTGADILESALGDVPGATTARTVNGEVVQPIEFLAGPNSGERLILSAPVGLRLYATCSSTGDLEVEAHTDRNARLLTWSFDTGGNESNNEGALENFTINNTPDLVNEDDGDQLGHTVYMTSAGNVTSIMWAADNNTSPAFGTQCAFVGTAASH